ncbi:hypothetical protein GCM10028805_56150 [Spirosoma harenae]
MKLLLTTLLLLVPGLSCKSPIYSEKDFEGKTFSVTLLKSDPNRVQHQDLMGLDHKQLMFLPDKKGVISDPSGHEPDRPFSWSVPADEDSALTITPEHAHSLRITIYPAANGYTLLDRMRHESDTANRYELLLSPVQVMPKAYPEKKFEGKTFQVTVLSSNPDREYHQAVMDINGMHLVFKDKEEGEIHDPTGKKKDHDFNWTFTGQEPSTSLILGLNQRYSSTLLCKIYLTKTGYKLIDSKPSLDDTTARFAIELKSVIK